MVHVVLHALLLAQVTPPPPPPLLTVSPVASAVPSPVAPGPPSPSPAATLLVSPAFVALNPAQQKTLVVSNASGALTVTTDARLVAPVIDQTADSITVTATQATGTDVLHVSDESGARV